MVIRQIRKTFVILLAAPMVEKGNQENPLQDGGHLLSHVVL